jgi:arylformamidase
MWKDISTGIREGMVQWPGDRKLNITKDLSLENGEEANVSSIETCVHLGTHIDAPLHFITNGDDVTKYPLEKLTGTARVIYLPGIKEISVAHLIDLEIGEGDKILFKTDNSKTNWVMESFNENFVALTADAAKYLSDCKIDLIGIDYLSIAMPNDNTEVHQKLLKNKICILEGLLLQEIEEGLYDFVCLPISIEQCDGSFARVIIREQGWG